MAKRLYTLLLVAACAVAQTVEGSVFNAATGTGAGGVTVELLRGTTPFYETTTDGGGRFRFDNLKEGDYAVRYQSPDYWLTAGPTDYKPFPVAAGSPVKLEARLMPWSKISGRVVDGRGNGVANARLELTGSGMVANGRTYLRTSWGGGGGGQLGESSMRMPSSGSTDARGKFEVQLMPGTYGLSVLPPPELKPPEPEQDGPVLAWKRSYYPGVALPEAASKIVVLPGGEVADVELKLLAVPAHAVRGMLFNPDGTPAPKVAIALADEFRGRSVESKPDGTFEFAAVPEGEWRFLAEVQKGGVQLRATEWIEVTKHDIESVKLRLVPPLTVRGKVFMEAPAGSVLPRMPPLILALRGGHSSRDGDLGLVGGSGPLTPDANGNFITQVYPGVYGVFAWLQPPPPPYYLDAIRIGDTDLLAQDVELPAAGSAITVVYKTDGGSVTGTAENCASGGVVLFPRDPSLRRFSRSGPCDSSDRYEVRAVRPGEYYAVAFAGNGPVLAADEALLNQAVKVTVQAGRASSADLRAITRPVF